METIKDFFREVAGATFRKFTEPGMNLEPDEMPTSDPMIGFPNGRKKLETTVSRETLKLARVHKEVWDFCAEKIMEWQRCKREHNFFTHYKCEHYKHEHIMCEHELNVIRYKEFERERRLRIRAAAKKNDEALAA